MSDDRGGRLRLAMFSPLPPVPSGIADYLVDLIPLLPESWRIDVYGPADATPDPGLLAGRGDALPHHEWPGRHAARPYDLNVYQVGNNLVHEYALPYVSAHPGLLVLHDAVLHPSRVAATVGRGDLDGYRAAARAARPDLGAELAETVVSGLGGEDLYWSFPLCEDLVRASRLTVVHGELLACWLRALVPGAEVGSIVHWQAVAEAAPGRVEHWRAHLGGDGAVPVIGTFGHIGPAHGLELLLEVLAELVASADFRLVIVGAVDDDAALGARIEQLGLGERVLRTGRVPTPEFAALMRAVDLAVNLRYPSARASSGTLSQLLQLGVPSVIHDLVHLRDLPDAAVIRVPPGPRRREREVLRRELATWLADPGARRRAATACRAWAEAHVRPDLMARSYREAVARARGASPPGP